MIYFGSRVKFQYQKIKRTTLAESDVSIAVAKK